MTSKSEAHERLERTVDIFAKILPWFVGVISLPVAIMWLYIIDNNLYPYGDRWQDKFETQEVREELRAEGKRREAEKAFLATLGSPIATICVNAQIWETSPPEKREEFYVVMGRRGRQKVNDTGCVRFSNDRISFSLHGWDG